MSANTKRISKRITDVKKHTLGYVLSSGKEVTRAKAVQMATRGLLKGVRLVTGPSGRHQYIQSSGQRGLYELPTVQR